MSVKEAQSEICSDLSLVNFSIGVMFGSLVQPERLSEVSCVWFVSGVMSGSK